MKNTLYGIGLDIGGVCRLGRRRFERHGRTCWTAPSGCTHFRQGRAAQDGRKPCRAAAHGARDAPPSAPKALRRADVYALLERSGLSTREALAQMFEAGGLEDIYALRTRALDEPVGKAEFSRILLHLAQRRGFKSNRRTASDGEDGRLLAAVNENRRRMAQGGWRTVGEMLYRHEAFALHKRNKADDYLSTVGRDMVAEEALHPVRAPACNGLQLGRTGLQAEYLSILLRQRSFDEGPGGNSPLRRQPGGKNGGPLHIRAG